MLDTDLMRDSIAGRSTVFLVEMVTGAQTVKAMAVEPEVQKRWEGLLANYVKASFKTYKLSGLLDQWGN